MKTSALLKPRTEADLDAERAAQERADRLDVQRSIQERVDLATGEDIEQHAPDRSGRQKPAYRRTGLAWLASRPVDLLDENNKPIMRNGKKLTQPFLDRHEEEQGKRYAELFHMARTGVVRSCLNFVEVRGGLNHTPNEIRAWALFQLHKIRYEVFRGHAELIRVCDNICGEDRRPSEFCRDRRDLENLPNTLKIALGLLVAHNR